MKQSLQKMIPPPEDVPGIELDKDKNLLSITVRKKDDLKDQPNEP